MNVEHIEAVFYGIRTEEKAHTHGTRFIDRQNVMLKYTTRIIKEVPLVPALIYTHVNGNFF